MPLLKKQDGETRDQYVARGLADAALRELIPEDDGRAAVLHAAFTSEAAGTQILAVFKKGKTYSVDVEMFAVGKWNGYEFSVRDLEEIVAAFNALGDNHKVPLKFGHNGDQPLTDGQPAIGWVQKVWLDRSSSPVKLVGRFTDVPEIVYNAMKQKLYRKVSVELDFDVEYKGATYGAVLSGVALLGADLPAVNVLADLEAYMTRRGNTDSSGVKFTRRVTFSYDPITGGNKMNEEELKRQLAELQAKFTQLQAENQLLKADKETFSRREAEREATDKRNKVAAKRTEVNTWCEEQIKAGTMLPAQRELFKKAIGYDNDDRLLATDVEPLKEMFGVRAKADGADAGFGGGSGNGPGNNGESATSRVMKMARERQARTKESLSDATYAVLQQDSSLAKAYSEEMDKEVAS